MAADLTACPWCRQVPGPVLFAVANASLSVVCNRCGAHGPYADSEADAASAWSATAGVQERYDFVLAACRDAQDMASRYGWALREIADMDPTGQRADDFGRAARTARAALLGQSTSLRPMPCEDCEHPTLCADFPDQHRTCGVPGTSNDQQEQPR